MEYLIRRIERRDLDRLLELCGKHAEFEKAEFSPNGKSEALEDAIFSPEPKLFCFVVESSAKLVGYASYTFDFSTWEAAKFLNLDCLYLEPEARGQGIGQVIMGQLKEIARLRNCSSLQWQTPTFNTEAIRFYRRTGGTGKEKMRFGIQIPETSVRPVGGC